jgi:iron-sulfur cluster repair protein YtfE (RIC family)
MTSESMLLQLQQSGESAPEMMDTLLNDLYPKIFSLWNEAEKKIRAMESFSNSALTTLAEKITQELSSLYIKERLILFPFLNELYLQNEKSKSCTPFKKITTHHTALMHLCMEMEHMLKQNDSPEEVSAELINDCGFFMKDLLSLNRLKQKYLFAPFKSCSTCRLEESSRS